ncbi:MAG: dihydrofolate reductase [Rickettsiaceae bacterium]
MTKLQKIVGIMAVTEEGVIGKNNSLPWNYPEELKHFRQITHEHTIVMGRKTYDSIPRNSLSNKKLIVFSRSSKTSDNNIIFVKSLHEYFDIINHLGESEKILMVGGAEIAHLFLRHKLISSFLLTRIHQLYSGDTYLDLKYFEGWSENILKSCPDYTIFQLINPRRDLI